MVKVNMEYIRIQIAQGLFQMYDILIYGNYAMINMFCPALVYPVVGVIIAPVPVGLAEARYI